eukprot:583989_1
MAIRNFTFWFNDSNFTCEVTFYESLVRWLFGIWVGLYTVVYILFLMILEITIQSYLLDTMTTTYDRRFCDLNCNVIGRTLSEMLMVFLSILIQIPTCVVQSILIWDPTAICTPNYTNIKTGEATLLLVLSYVFIGIRSASHRHWSSRTYIGYTFFYQTIQILSIHCFTYWTNTNMNDTTCESNYYQSHHGFMADYVYVMFWIWIVYDFSINILGVIPYLFGDIHRRVSDDKIHKKAQWLWYGFFIGLLCIQLPTALLQLIMAWLDLNNDLLVFDSITMILCVWFALMIFQYRWMNIIRDHLIRVLLFCAVGLCFILSIHSITLVPSDHFIWSLLLICIIIYSLLSLFFVVSVFRGLYADGSRILDIITLVATTILFLLQTIVALFQLDYLANAS